jgi:hypothetical protein
MMMSNLLELFTKCNYCKREIEDGGIYLKHPSFGIVCEYCDPFKDGGVEINSDEDEDA